MQIEAHYASQDVSLVGYFHANERSDDYDLSNIGDHLCRYFPQAGILLLDNQKLEALPKLKDQSPVMQLFSRDGSKWKVEENSRLAMKEPSANTILLDYASTQKTEDIIDFDDHLDDISKDWLNAELFK